jgi:hypothetical protein
MLIWSFTARALAGGLPLSIFATSVVRGGESDTKKKDEKKDQIKVALEPEPQKPFLPRLIDNFGEALRTPAWTPPDPNAPPSTRRVLPAPFDSPPFFESEHSPGGAPTLGDPNDPTIYPLMKTIYQSGRFGQWLKDQRINIYGWVEFGANASTSGVNNLPAAYEYRPNQPELDQLVLYFARKPDEAQRSHVDWGFLFANLYGLDYHFTISRGI